MTHLTSRKLFYSNQNQKKKKKKKKIRSLDWEVKRLRNEGEYSSTDYQISHFLNLG